MRSLLLPVLLCLAVACGGSDDDDDSAAGGAGQGGSAAGTSSAGVSGTAGAGLAGAAGTSGTGQGGASGAGAGGAAGGGAAGMSGTSGQSGAAGAMAGASGAGAGGTAAGAGGASGAGMGGAAGATGCGACDQPGQVCVQNVCKDDCRLPGAVACAAGTVCTVGSENKGQCVPPDEGCVVTSAQVTCGTKTCGPGTTCGLKGDCVPSLPCVSMGCSGSTCWGESCSCTRPIFCAPAPLGAPGEAKTLNDPAFLRGGKSASEGAFDLDFDPSCNAWAVTIISGPDYLRKSAPDGTVSSVTGVTNLNMGEVAVLTGKDGGFSGGDGSVALTYTCCATCGCILSGSGGNPQGAAIFDATTSTLPMKIPSTDFTTGNGPFGSSTVDTGPYGLTWGLDRVLYLGNVVTNGDFYALDVLSGTKELITTFPKRVNAATPLDGEQLLVALEGNDIVRVPALGISGEPVTVIAMPAPVTSLVLDPWSGRVYAELGDLSIVSFRPGSSQVTPFATAPHKGRIAMGPDGYLYHLTVYPDEPEVVRFALPTTPF